MELEFDPLDYDIYHLGVSGGKDSTAAMLWLIYESGWPTSRMIVTFCDTDNEDSLTYNYLALLSERVFPIETVYPELGFYELALKKRRFPSRKARFCTEMLKIVPSMKHIEVLKKRGKVLILNGVRRAEGRSSNNRGDLPQFFHDDTYGCDRFMPIYEWSIEDIWEAHKKHMDPEDVLDLIRNDEFINEKNKAQLVERQQRHGVPRNPLYDMGARRVGCFPCINSAKKEIRAISMYRPERIDFIEQKERSFIDNPNKYSTMFAKKTVPERWRTKEVVTAKGAVVKVATIRDVVEWSKTAWGASQFSFEFSDFDDDYDTGLHCDMRGMCE